MGIGICEHRKFRYGSEYTYLEHNMVSQEFGAWVTAYEIGQSNLVREVPAVSLGLK